MISTIILLGLWRFVFSLGLDSRGNSEAGSKSHWWSLSFLVAAGLLSSIHCLELVILKSANISRALVYAQTSAAITYLAYELTRKDKNRRIEMNIFFLLEGRFNQFLAFINFGILCLFSIGISAPLSWDSNAYNLARIPIFLFENNLVLSQGVANDARQAIYPILHDTLYTSDLIIGNTRGLTLISTIELAIIFGLLLCTLEHILSIEKNNSQGLKAKKIRSISQTILILGVASSSQQILQAINTKNDLFITLLACQIIASLLSLIQNSELLKRADFYTAALGIGFAISMSIASKAYGIINIIPAGLALLLWPKQFMPWKYNPIEKKNESDIQSNLIHKRRIILMSLTLTSVLVIFFYHKLGIDGLWSQDNERLKGVTTVWINTNGPIEERVYNATLHLQRLIAQIITFPITANRVYMPLLDGIDAGFLNALIPPWLIESHGAVEPFALYSQINLDRAFPFLLATLIMLFGIGGILSDRILRSRKLSIFFIANAMANLCVICSALYYNSFMSRYLGPVFLPILPITSLAITLMLERLRIQKPVIGGSRKQHMAIKRVIITFATVMPVISAISLSQYISTTKGLPQDYRSYYSSFLNNQLGMDTNQVNETINQLESKPYTRRVLCSDGGNIVLIPILLSMNNKSYDGNNLSVKPMNSCKSKIRSNQENPDLEYIELPYF